MFLKAISVYSKSFEVIVNQLKAVYCLPCYSMVYWGDGVGQSHLTYLFSELDEKNPYE